MKLYTPEISWHSQDAIFAIDFQPLYNNDGYRVATGGIEKNIKIWLVKILNSDKAPIIKFLSNLKRHQCTINTLRFSPDGLSLASGDSEGVVNIWQLSQSICPDIFKSVEDGEPDNVEIWNVVKRFREHKADSDVCDLCWSPDSKHLLSCSSDNTIIVWDMEAGKKVKMIHENAKRFPVGLAWDPKNEFFVSMSNDRTMSVFNTVNYQKIAVVTNAMLPSVSDQSKMVSCKLFHDSSLMSYVRRPCFTIDGSFLLTPAGCAEEQGKVAQCTYAFQRPNFRQPSLILPCLNEPSIGVYCCPVSFELLVSKSNVMKLPYRLIYAVLTKKSIILYDSQNEQPFGYISNMHYVSLTDCTWSKDGRCLLICSEDGYCSFLIFDQDEFGKINNQSIINSNKNDNIIQIIDSPKIGKKIPVPPNTPTTTNIRNFLANKKSTEKNLKKSPMEIEKCGDRLEKIDNQSIPENLPVQKLRLPKQSNETTAKRRVNFTTLSEKFTTKEIEMKLEPVSEKVTSTEKSEKRRVNFITLTKAPIGEDIIEYAITKPTVIDTKCTVKKQ